MGAIQTQMVSLGYVYIQHTYTRMRVTLTIATVRFPGIKWE